MVLGLKWLSKVQGGTKCIGLGACSNERVLLSESLMRQSNPKYSYSSTKGDIGC